MELKNESYDLGKWLVIIFMPSFAVFIGGLAELYAWQNASAVVGSINLLTVFLGSILQLSSQTYYNDWGAGPDDPKSH